MQRELTETELLLLTTPDDTEDAAWMVMPDFQWLVIALLRSILRRHVARQHLPWYLASELTVIMPRINSPRPLTLGPDLMKVTADVQLRSSWNIAEEGKPPEFVLEVVTDKSETRDLDEKPLLYNSMGVTEYAIFWPERRDGGPVLLGYHRGHGDQWVAWSTDADGVLWSRALGGLGLYVEEGLWLRVRDSEGERLLSPEEEAERQLALADAAARRADREAEHAAREAARAEQEAARAEQEAARAEQEAARAEQEAARAEQEAAARQVAEQRAELEAAARRAAEAEVARLRALLEERGQ